MQTSCLFILLASVAVGARAGEPSFAGQVLPLLKSRCLVCHMPGGESGGLSLHPRSAYANLVGVRSTQSPLLRVSPGKPEESYLYLKLTGEHLRAGGTGERQPFDEAPLPDEDIDLVRRWIETGARP
jgi:mono/diheme cytochrome c family protein